MTDKMKAVVKVKPEPNGTEIMMKDVPKPGPHDALIKVKAASICGTDVHIYNWDNWAKSRIKTPLLYGHEFAGEVIEIGDEVQAIEVGDFVSGECHIACGHCHQCRTGQKHICQNTQVFGVDSPGVFAEYACIPAKNVWENDKDIPGELCSIQDPFGNAVHSVFSTDIVGKDVAIVGLGPIGLMCAALCLHAGAAQVFTVEKFNDYRIDLAKKLGVKNIYQDAKDAKQNILDITEGKGADIVLEMSGASQAVRPALDLLRKGGQLILLGVYNEPVNIDLTNDIVFKYITVKGIFGRRMFEDWYRMKGLLRIPAIRQALKTIVTHKYPFDKFSEAMETMRSGQSGKVVLELFR